jgi:hypothetical protein
MTKINRSVLVAVAMMIGATAALGCKGSEDQGARQDSAAAPASAPVDPGQAPAASPSKDEGATIFAKASVGASTQGRAAPPPPVERVEYPGRAPSREHTWMKGYWRWDTGGVRYVWEPGHWMVQFAPSAPPAPRYEEPGRPPSERHVWVRGYHKWTGHEWIWINGHWDVKRADATYVGAHWDRVHGRWQYVPGYWAPRRR